MFWGLGTGMDGQTVFLVLEIWIAPAANPGQVRAPNSPDTTSFNLPAISMPYIVLSISRLSGYTLTFIYSATLMKLKSLFFPPHPPTIYVLVPQPYPPSTYAILFPSKHRLRSRLLYRWFSRNNKAGVPDLAHRANQGPFRARWARIKTCVFAVTPLHTTPPLIYLTFSGVSSLWIGYSTKVPIRPRSSTWTRS